MVHKMRLVDFAFKAIKNKEKDIELRLNDEKRRLINIGDIIEFEHVDTKEIVRVEVINLHKYDTFDELFSKFDHKRFGLSDTDDASIMNNFYSKEEQDKYGALGIEIKVID
ncbi:MAG: RNA-binding protein [Bacilli bacterium]|nr:RNA-binding protein [Bacilli bacterium]